MCKFNQDEFKQYFFYGIDNREELLEGIIFFTNKELNLKYLNMMDDKKLPTLTEKFENMLEASARNYEQIYKFIDLAPDPIRADVRLSEEERQKIRQIVKDKIEQLDQKEQFIKTRRGIFCKFEHKFSCSRNTKNWVNQIYKIVMGLNYLENNDYIEYYDKWLQVKVNRLENSGKYSSEAVQTIKDLYYKFRDKKGEKAKTEQDESR